MGENIFLIRIFIGILFFAAAVLFDLKKYHSNFIIFARYLLFALFLSVLIIFCKSVNDAYAFIRLFSISFVATFFENHITRFVFLLRRPKCECFFFSDLNEQSLVFADNLRKNDRKCLIVFCNTGAPDKIGLSHTAAKKQYFTFHDEINSFFINLKKNSKHRITFVECSDDRDRNLKNTLEIIDFYSKREDNSNYKIILFSEAGTDDETILNSIDKRGIEVLIFNQSITAAYQLVFNNSIIEKSHGNTVTVLIAGCGRTGSAFLKTLVWCGQLGDCIHLKINVIDKDAAYIESILKLDCPELFIGNYDIEFHEQDLMQENTECLLKKNCIDTDFVAVCLGDDETNTKIALYMRKFFIRENPAHGDAPFIALRIKDPVRAQSINHLNAKNRGVSHSYNLVSFGDYSSIVSGYSDSGDEINNLALNAHSIYSRMFGENDVEWIKKSFYQNETNRRSSRATVIHAKYKLEILGYTVERITSDMKLQPAFQIEYENSKRLLSELKEKLQNPENVEKFGIIEHDRWNAFQRTEGWTSASFEEAEEYSVLLNGENPDHRFYRAKKHACICSWEELDKITEKFDMHIKDYDFEFFTKIPEIFGLTEDSKNNISRVSYLLKKIQK